MDKLLKTILLYNQLLGVEKNKEISTLKTITEEKLKHHFGEISEDILRELLSYNRSIESKIGVLDGFLELHRKLGLDQEKIKNMIKKEYESELVRTDYLKEIEEQMIGYGKHFLEIGAVEEDYLKDLWRDEIQRLIFQRITKELVSNYYRYFVGKKGEIIKVPLETFLENVKKDTLKGFNKLYQKAGFSQKDTTNILKEVVEGMGIKKEHDKAGNVNYVYHEGYGYRCCIPSFKMLYKTEFETDEDILKEVQNANKDLDAILKISEKQGVSVKTDLEGNYNSLKIKKEIVQRMLEAKKAEIVIAVDLEIHNHNNRYGQKYVLGLNKDNKIKFASYKVDYHRSIGLYSTLGGGYITIGIKEPKEKLENIEIKSTSADYGKEPREITLKLLQKAMPWCNIVVED